MSQQKTKTADELQKDAEKKAYLFLLTERVVRGYFFKFPHMDRHLTKLRIEHEAVYQKTIEVLQAYVWSTHTKEDLHSYYIGLLGALEVVSVGYDNKEWVLDKELRDQAESWLADKG